MSPELPGEEWEIRLVESLDRAGGEPGRFRPKFSLDETSVQLRRVSNHLRCDQSGADPHVVPEFLAMMSPQVVRVLKSLRVSVYKQAGASITPPFRALSAEEVQGG